MSNCDHESIFKKWCAICNVTFCERCAELYEPFESSHSGYRECKTCKDYFCVARFAFDEDVCSTCQLRVDIELLSQKFNQSLKTESSLKVIKTRVAYRYDHDGRPVAYKIGDRVILRTHPAYCYSTTKNHYGRIYDYTEQGGNFKCRSYQLDIPLGENLEQVLKCMDRGEFIKFISAEDSAYEEYVYITPCDLDYEKFSIELEYDLLQEHELGIIEYQGQVWKIFTSEYNIPATTIFENSDEYTEIEDLREFIMQELGTIDSSSFEGYVYRGRKIVGYVFSHPFRETIIAYVDGDAVPSADPSNIWS